MGNEDKQEEKTKPRIVILYQGENATTYRKHVVERLKYYNAEPVEVAFNEEGYEDDVEINKRVIGDMMKCDGAIALLTKDTRAASACGNLWLEVGLWIGLKSRRTIRIIQEGQPDSWDKNEEWPVKLPSNMLGEYCPEFKTNDKLSELINVFVEKIRSVLRPSSNVDNHTEKGIFIDELKIKDILMKDSIAWGPGELYFCQERNEKNYECLYRKEMIVLLCEFLRMGECDWDHWLIEVCFHRLTHLCKVAVLVDYMETIKDPITRAEQRQKAIDEIHDIVSLLGSNAEKSLKWPSGKEAVTSSGWEKLKDYLVYRLNLAYCLKWHSVPNDRTRNSYIDDVNYFCAWAQELSNDDYKTHSYYKEGFIPFGSVNTASEMVLRFQNCLNIAKDISQSLSALKTEFFAQCCGAIENGTNILTDPSKFINSLRTIRGSLPAKSA